MVLCCLLFVVRVSVTFTLCLLNYLWLSGHLLGKSCSLCLPYVPFVFSLFVILAISRYGFEGGIWDLIAPVPDQCILFTYNFII